ncbi:hypothetical protein GUJ93_ZPchr0010g8233 [Zizania palustris]|uniref:KOW domain-containing protein n=1 Tax=Zizania palustris TaxID=103762 RepID=A0A8J6BJU6_ZIZPA|nr:hypothetical protein GUJ93_ZPchr0010g8233 [Zizania palustris]
MAAVKGKGKQVASGPPRGSDASTSAAKRRMGSGDAGPSSSAAAAKRRRPSGVRQFVDDAAGVCDEYDEEEELESEDDLDDWYGFFTEGKTENVSFKRTERSHPLPFLGIVKEEELSGDELEEFINEPTIWRVKCMVGRERQMAFCFMQKFVDLQKFGTKVPIISAFALDHVRGFVFVEAEKACDVTEACKGFCCVYVSRISSVPAAEVPSLLSSRTKPFTISPGTWVRMKNGNYKGDLAQVASADNARKRVMIKLIPRVDLQAISKKFGGAISLKEAAVPAPRLISSQELEFFRPHMEMRRDRQTGDVYEVLDGLMFKDGFLYKRVALSSLIYWGIQPTETELLKFSSSPTNKSSADDLDWVSRMYGPKKRNLPRERDMKASSSKASSSKDKCSKASNLKASTSTENCEDDGFNLHDLVLFGRKDFGVVIAFEKDGLRILKGGPEGSAVNIRKQDIKKVCADKMFTAVDHKKKAISINDTVNVLEGPFQGKQGVVKHLYMGILFIHNESESENSGFFCAQCGSCENVKKRKELAGSTTGNSDDSPIPMFSYEQNEQRDNERPYRSTREQLFSIGEVLRIRKGPLKGYLCRVVRIFRNDVTVKLDSLLKIVTVQAEFLSVPIKRGDNSSGAPSSFGNQDTPFFGSEANKTSWDNGLPSFGSDSWQPFSSSAAPVQNADGESEVDPWCKKTSLSVADDSDPWSMKTKPAPSAIDDSDPWNMKTKSTSVDVWNNDTTQKESASPAAWDKQPGGSGSNVGGSSWDRATADKESGRSDNWGEAKETDKTSCDTDPWGSKVKEVEMKETDGWEKASMQPEKSEDGSHGWGQSAGKSNQDQETGTDKSGAWDTVIANRVGSSSSVPSGGDADAWVKSDTLPVAQDDAWGKSKDNNSDGAVGWKELKTSNPSHDTGGWDTAAANWNESSAVDGHKESWGKEKDTTAKFEDKNNESESWNKATPSDQVCGSGWGNPKFSSGDGRSNWNKGEEAGGDSENSSWSRPGGNSVGGRGFGRGQSLIIRSTVKQEIPVDIEGEGEEEEGASMEDGEEEMIGQVEVEVEEEMMVGEMEVGDSSEFGKSDADAPSWGNSQMKFADGDFSSDWDKGASNKGSRGGEDNWNTPNSSINLPWSSHTTKSSDENQASTWNSSEDKKPSGGEQNDPWASKISSKGQEQQSDAWASKITPTAGAEDKRDIASGTPHGRKRNLLGENQSFSAGDQEPAWSNPKYGDVNCGYGRDGGFGQGNRGRGRGRNFGDSRSSWSGGSNRNDESRGERSGDRWNRRDFDGGRGRGRGRFGQGDRTQGNNFGSGDNNDSSWGSGRGNRDRDGGKSWNQNDDRRPFDQDQGGGWSNSSDWNANKGSTEDQYFSKGKSSWGNEDQSFSKGKSSWGNDKNDSWGAPKPSGGVDQAGRNDGNNAWSENKSSCGHGSSILGQWGAPPGSTTTGGGSVGGGGSWENKTEDSRNGSGVTTEKSSWGGSEADPKKEGSWEKSQGSGGSNSWDKADGAWNSDKGGDTQGWNSSSNNGNDGWK